MELRILLKNLFEPVGVRRGNSNAALRIAGLRAREGSVFDQIFAIVVGMARPGICQNRGIDGIRIVASVLW
jgi:hypothetical protein